LIVSAPENLRAELRGGTSDAQIAYRVTVPLRGLENRTTNRAMRSTAHRIQALKAEANELERDIARLVDDVHPELAQLPGVGALSAAQILISWSHHGRLRSEAAFATLAGAAPTPRLLRSDIPPSPQPRRPPTQPSAPHHRAHPQRIDPATRALHRSPASRK